jgi:hypothetical protein
MRMKPRTFEFGRHLVVHGKRYWLLYDNEMDYLRHFNTAKAALKYIMKKGQRERVFMPTDYNNAVHG